MWQIILRVVTYVLSGVGVGELVNHFKPEIVPAHRDENGGINWMKILLIIGTSIVGAILVKFIAKFLKIRLPF